MKKARRPARLRISSCQPPTPYPTPAPKGRNSAAPDYSLIGSCHAAVRDPYLCPHKPQTPASQREADAVAVYVPTKMSVRDAVCNSALTLNTKTGQGTFAVRSPAVKSQVDVIVVTSSIPDLGYHWLIVFERSFEFVGRKASDDDSSTRPKHMLLPHRG